MEENKRQMESLNAGMNMITKEELKNYAKIRGLNLGQAEKDYFQNIILFILYQAYGSELVFKGGTALNKCYGLDRFSEDLDFTCSNTISVGRIEEGLKRFRLDFEMKKDEYENGVKISLLIKGPLYTGIRLSLCKFIIDLSFRENVVLKPTIKIIGRFLEEIPAFDVLVMNENEILAEKIRAIMSRTKARDVYDLWFLLKKGVKFDVELAKKKLEYYSQEWNFEEFRKHINLKESVWLSELKPLIDIVPDFKETRDFILKNISKKK